MDSYVLVIFFSSPLQIVLSLSLLVLVGLILFELILDYFGSNNLSLYQNTILAMLRTDQHSVCFSQFHQFGLVRSTSVHFGKFWSNSVYFGLLQFNWVHLVYFDQFSPIQSIWSISVQFGQSILVGSNLAYSVNLVHVDLFGPIGSTLVHSVYIGPLGLFSPLQIISVQVSVPIEEWQNTSLG